MTRSTMQLIGLYAITDMTLCATQGVETAVAHALEGGAAIVQYRDKSGDRSRRSREARTLARLCASFDVPFIVNDDVALAASVNASGVHLGQDDDSLADARRTLGANAIIGVSCYHQIELSEAAEAAGADYVAFGRFFDSRTKPGQPRADLELLGTASARLAVPIAAIGGISADNAAPLVSAGASMLACIHGVFGQPDVRSAAASLSALFPPRRL